METNNYEFIKNVEKQPTAPVVFYFDPHINNDSMTDDTSTIEQFSLANSKPKNPNRKVIKSLEICTKQSTLIDLCSPAISSLGSGTNPKKSTLPAMLDLFHDEDNSTSNETISKSNPHFQFTIVGVDNKFSRDYLCQICLEKHSIANLKFPEVT